MIFKFKYKGKEIEMDVLVCDNVFSKAGGLMFRRKSKPLLFVFNKLTKQSIHSFFCKPFYAIWFDGDRIVDEKFINVWRWGIKPNGRFNRLLEIPTGCGEFKFLSTIKRNI